MSPSNSILENLRSHWTLEEQWSEEEGEWRHGGLSSFKICLQSDEDPSLGGNNHCQTDINSCDKKPRSLSPHQGWLTPKLATSKTRPLEMASMTFSSLEEDDKSEDSGTDQTVTLKVSCASSGSPTPSLPSMTLSVAASSSYGTPHPSPLMSPQSSFHSCRSSAYLSSPSESGFDKSFFMSEKNIDKNTQSRSC